MCKPIQVPCQSPMDPRAGVIGPTRSNVLRLEVYMGYFAIDTTGCVQAGTGTSTRKIAGEPGNTVLEWIRDGYRVVYGECSQYPIGSYPANLAKEAPDAA